MKSWIIIFCLALGLVSCHSSHKNEKAYESNFVKGRGGFQLIALIHAKGADFAFDGDHLQTGELTLRYVAPTVVCLTDESMKRAHNLPITDFVQLWQKGELTFPEETMNGGFVAFSDAQKEWVDVTFDLNKPRYNESTQVLIFDIEGWESKQHRSKGHKQLKHLDDVTIYIEGISKQQLVESKS